MIKVVICVAGTCFKPEAVSTFQEMIDATRPDIPQAGQDPAYRAAIAQNVYLAMRDAFNVPEDDQFMTVSEHEAGDFVYNAHYLGIERSDDLVIIEITANDTRTVEQKKALYKRIAERLAEEPGIRGEDVFVSLVEVRKENWSFGLGIAQYADW